MIYIYIYIYICVCVCVCVCLIKFLVQEKLYRQTDSGIICKWENRLFNRF